MAGTQQHQQHHHAQGQHGQSAGGGHQAVGQYFGLPGITRPMEQTENNDGTTTTLSQTNQVDAIFAANFKQSDVVEWWEMEVTVNQTITAGGATITASPYFPYNIIGPMSLNMQNQFDTNNFTNGIDAAIFQMIRPHYDNYLNVLDQTLALTNAYSSQSNLNTATNYTSASSALKFTLDLAPGIYFDEYFELDVKGKPLHTKPIRAFVSPQMMSGSNRIIQPKVRFNPFFATTADNGPYTTSGGAPTASGTAKLGFQRFGYYQPVGPADSPILYSWQYAREAKRYSVAGQSSFDIPLPLTGQILCVWARFFDPAANSGVGAPIAVNSTNFTNAYLQYGSGLYRYQDQGIQRTQRRIERAHGQLPIEGVLVWDMALDKWGKVSNRYALNTLDTTGIQLHFDLPSSLSSTAYCVIGTESLRYVAQF